MRQVHFAMPDKAGAELVPDHRHMLTFSCDALQYAGESGNSQGDVLTGPVCTPPAHIADSRLDQLSGGLAVDGTQSRRRIEVHGACERAAQDRSNCNGVRQDGARLLLVPPREADR